MEKAYKSLGAYHPCRPGDDKHESTHVVMSMDEYDRLIAQRQSLKYQIDALEDKHKHETYELKQAATKSVQSETAEARARAEEAEARAREAEEERDRQIGLNQNLLRISKERANAKRGLQPKSKHCGYRFSGKIMQTKTISGHDKTIGAIYADVWTATLETPYDAAIPLDQIEGKIIVDLCKPNGILHKMSIHYWTVGESDHLWKGTYQDAVGDLKEQDMDQNYLIDYKFAANPRSGLWEIQITTTQAMHVINELS